MGNIIRMNKDTPVNEWISMSNGCTSMMIDLIGLSGTRLAANEDEKILITWILEKDQSCCGMGTVGFDLCEIPWNKARFPEQKNFILKVLDGMCDKSGWEMLDYQPDEEIAFRVIGELRHLVVSMTEKDIDEQEGQAWLHEIGDDEPMKNGFPVCSKHNMLLTLFGCHACNN